MVATDWLTLGGTELVNTNRVRAYAAQWGVDIQCPPCEGMDEALWGDDPGWPGYQTPAQDDAPWFDPAVPESARFLGIFGISFQGFSNNPVDRTLTPRVGDGSFVGRLRRTHRELNLTVGLVAADEAAMVWGLEWLAATLRGTVCGSDACGGDDLCVFASCPCGPEGEFLRLGDRELRHVFDVGLVSGPSENTRYTVPGARCVDPLVSQCGDPIVAEVSITLAAGRPWLYHEPVPTDPDSPTWNKITSGTLVTGFDPDVDDCPTIPDCLEDPLCGPLPTLPQVPIPVDPCYPRGPYNAWRLRFAYDPLRTTEWLELVPVVIVETGARPLRRLTIRFIPNPNNLDCEDLSNCGACGHLTVAYLPARSTFTVDGRVSRAAVDCPSPNGSAFSVPNLFGRNGGAYTWPTFECGGVMCVEIYAAADADAGAQVRMELVPRGDLA